MDNGVPPSNKRPAARPAGGGSKSRGGQPADPRTESPSGNGSRNGGRPAPQRSHGTPAAPKKTTPKPARRRDDTAPSGLVAPVQPVTTASSVAVVDTESSPFPLLTPKPSTRSPLADTNGNGHGNGTAHADTATVAFVDEAPIVDEAPAKVLLPPIVPAEPDTAPVHEPEPDVIGEGLELAPPKVHLPPRTEAVEVFTDTDGTDGLPSLLKPKKPPRALRAPVVVPQRRRPRVRRVTRVIRHVDTWSVFKVALVFNLFLYGVCLTAGVLLWQVAQNTGTVDNVERFFESFGWQTFTLKGGEIFHNAWIAGLFVIVGLTGLAVLMATLFNLITDLVGGIRVSVLEEEVIAREERGLGWRRSARRAAAHAAAAESAGQSEPS